MQVLDLGGATLEYYSDYEFEDKPDDWKNIIQLVTSEKIKLRKSYYTSGKTFIDPWMNVVILEVPKEGQIDQSFVQDYFNHDVIESYHSEILSSGAISSRFWLNSAKTDRIESASYALGIKYFSTLFFEAGDQRFLIIHWLFTVDQAESLRRESRKIFKSLQIK
jgi:hypothetical protein